MQTAGERLVVGVVCEAPDDCRVVAILVRRLSGEEPTTCGADAGTAFLSWVRAAHYEVSGFRYLPFARGIIEPTAREGDRALLILEALKARPRIVVMVRDTMKGNTRKGLEQARDRRAWPFEVAIGVADPEREAWILNGFTAKTSQEKAALAKLKKSWKLDPTKKPHRLGALRDSKAAVEALTAGDQHRAWSCLEHRFSQSA